MYQVSATNIGTAHYYAVKKIIENGYSDTTEDNEKVLKLDRPLCIHIDNPSHSYDKSPNSPYGLNFDDAYIRKVCDITPRLNDGNDATYTYGNRIRDYPIYGITHPDIVGDGNLDLDQLPQGYDQLNACIQKLESHPTSRRAVMSTWVPYRDHESNEPPCIMIVDFKIDSRGRLTLLSYIRSNDILMAWGENVVGLRGLQRIVSTRLGIPSGWIETISRDAHVYYRRDQNYLHDMGFSFDD